MPWCRLGALRAFVTIIKFSVFFLLFSSIYIQNRLSISYIYTVLLGSQLPVFGKVTIGCLVTNQSTTVTADIITAFVSSLQILKHNQIGFPVILK